jgi:hypothetical protein
MTGENKGAGSRLPTLFRDSRPEIPRRAAADFIQWNPKDGIAMLANRLCSASGAASYRRQIPDRGSHFAMPSRNLRAKHHRCSFTNCHPEKCQLSPYFLHHRHSAKNSKSAPPNDETVSTAVALEWIGSDEISPIPVAETFREKPWTTDSGSRNLMATARTRFSRCAERFSF